MLFHIRGEAGNAMIMVQGEQVRNIAQTAGYTSWHPSGRLMVYSVNKLSLFFHTKGETRDVFDADSDLNLYRVDANVVVAPPAISLPHRNETWPSWSPDGGYLYFCSADKLPEERFREVRYDLMRVRYDLEKDLWGEPETLVSSTASRLSAAQPSVSPDGRWLVFSLCKYGNFPIYQPSADLYLMDLTSREYHKLEINSDQTDSWHSWSSNGRWMVFGSKRRDGVFTHPYFTHVDEQGRFSKPFILPQEDPAFYDSCLKNFNRPEFLKEPIRIQPAEFARNILATGAKIQPRKDTVQPPRAEQNDKGAAQ
jgi:dipeptidyl aminopeptidase/acylaminoacyl peptidase